MTSYLFILSRKSEYFKEVIAYLKGCGKGPWLVLVSPCLRENEVATCKIGSFLCSLDNLLQKNVIVLFFFGNQISKWRSFKKGAIFDLLFTFFSHQGKLQKNPSAHISLTYKHVFCLPYWLFLPYQLKKTKQNKTKQNKTTQNKKQKTKNKNKNKNKEMRIYQIPFLFGMNPVVDSYSRRFGKVNK